MKDVTDKIDRPFISAIEWMLLIMGAALIALPIIGSFFLASAESRLVFSGALCLTVGFSLLQRALYERLRAELEKIKSQLKHLEEK
jgi:hypothetical protein